MITFLLTYEIDPLQAAAVERYASGWMTLVREHGGVHHGFHVSRDVPDEMIGFFAFQSQAQYDEFRKRAIRTQAANALWELARATRSVRFRERQVFQSVAQETVVERIKGPENALSHH